MNATADGTLKPRTVQEVLTSATNYRSLHPPAVVEAADLGACVSVSFYSTASVDGNYSCDLLYLKSHM